MIGFRTILSAAALVALIGAPSASAKVLSVASYSMVNGNGTAVEGDFNYWDATYNGSGNKTVDNSFLSGGTGALTNGVIATKGFSEVSNQSGTGQYVGWKYTDPLINFHLATTSRVDSISFFVDNSNVGLVAAPETITVNGVTYTPVVSHPFGANNPAIELIVVLSQPIIGSNFAITLHAGPFGPDAKAYNEKYPNFPIPGDREPWMMLSEVQFNGVEAVPELSTWGMMLLGFAMFGFIAYRRKSSQPAAV